jgi:hypothetical protein
MKGTAVLRRGVLQGMQLEGTCDVVVRMRETRSEPQFTEGFVLNAPPSLPDGEYLVHFECQTMHARKDHGRWLYSNKIRSEGKSSPPDATPPHPH